MRTGGESGSHIHAIDYFPFHGRTDGCFRRLMVFLPVFGNVKKLAGSETECIQLISIVLRLLITTVLATEIQVSCTFFRQSAFKVVILLLRFFYGGVRAFMNSTSIHTTLGKGFLLQALCVFCFSIKSALFTSPLNSGN